MGEASTRAFPEQGLARLDALVALVADRQGLALLPDGRLAAAEARVAARATGLRNAWAQIDESLRAGLTFGGWCHRVPSRSSRAVVPRSRLWQPAAVRVASGGLAAGPWPSSEARTLA